MDRSNSVDVTEQRDLRVCQVVGHSVVSGSALLASPGSGVTLLALVGRPERLEPNPSMAAKRQPALTAIGGCCELNAAARVALTAKDGERCFRPIELHDRQYSNTAQQPR
jgi:hypothetical protein